MTAPDVRTVAGEPHDELRGDGLGAARDDPDLLGQAGATGTSRLRCTSTVGSAPGVPRCRAEDQNCDWSPRLAEATCDEGDVAELDVAAG